MYDDLLCYYPLPDRPAWSEGRGFALPAVDWAFDPHVLTTDGRLLREADGSHPEIDPYTGMLYFFARADQFKADGREVHYYTHFDNGRLQAVVKAPTALSPSLAAQRVKEELERVLLRNALHTSTQGLGQTHTKRSKI